MKRILITVFLAIFIAFNSAIASTWVQIDNDNYIDKDSIKTYTNDHGTVEYNKKIFWLKCIKRKDFYEKIEKITKKKISYDLAQYIVDYANKTITVKSNIIYSTDGNPIINRTYRDYDLVWYAISPSSSGELWAELAKKREF